MSSPNNEVPNQSIQKPVIKKRKTKVKFTPLEDKLLQVLVENSTEIDWNAIAAQFYKRNARQCRERWQNYVNPQIRNKEWKPEEDQEILMKVGLVGFHWNAIARTMNGRSGNAVRNRYMALQRQMKKQQSFDSVPTNNQTSPYINHDLHDQYNHENAMENSTNQQNQQVDADCENISKIAESSIFDDLFDQETFDIFENVFF